MDQGIGRFPAACIVLMVFLVYIPSMKGDFIWDDIDNVPQNVHLRTTDGLKRIWAEPGAVMQYYPLTYSSFWVEYHFWGTHPAGYHIVNVLLHAINCIFLWTILHRLDVPGAWLAAAFFAVHPVHVESVAWITERKNVLSGFFGLAALLAYLRFVKDGKWPAYAAACILFVGALLSKTVTCTLPIVIGVLLWWKRDRIEWRDVTPLIPMVLLGAGMGWVTMSVEKDMGAWGSEWAISFADRCLIAGRSLWFYAGNALWSGSHSIIYPRWPIGSGNGWGWLFPASAIGVIGLLWGLRSRIGKTPLTAALLFVIPLSPVLGFVDFYFMKYSFVADHFQYLADCSFVAVLGALLGGRYKVPAAVWLTALGVVSWHQGRIYNDEETLWRDTLAKNAGAWAAHNNLGLIVSKQGKLDEAVFHYTESLKINPGNPEAHNNFGNLLADQGRIDEARAHYEDALRKNPYHSESYNNVGMILDRQGKSAEAMACFSRALQINPSNVVALTNLGIILGRQGRIDEAISYFAEAVRINPDHPEARRNLEMSLEWKRRQAAPP